MNKKSKYLAAAGHICVAWGIVYAGAGIAMGILERYIGAMVMLLGSGMLLALAMTAYRGVRRKTELCMDADWREEAK